MTTRRGFERLRAEGYTHIPMTREVTADLDTPISVYLKLANTARSYLLESVSGGERWGRYSIIGLPCADHIEVHGNEVAVYHDGEVGETAECDDPLAWIGGFVGRFRVAPLQDAARFTGGLVGYFGYDTARYIEPCLAPTRKPDVVDVPDIVLFVSQEVVVFDRLKNSLSIVLHVDAREENAYDVAHRRLDELSARLEDKVPGLPPDTSATLTEDDFSSNFGKPDFMRAVETAREYITKGDVMQVVLSQCMNAPFTAHPLNLYRELRRTNPSPYMYCLDFDGFHVVGSSPEILVRMEGEELIVRPIAGTRARGATPRQDALLEAELLSDEKELAEHLMLIDLGRNDLGRVCQPGSVRVTERMITERYSHVMHIVSHVVGRRNADASAIDVLRATFPAGTVSGAPKVRAMELIDEIEPIKRHVYSGAIGYLAWSGAMDTAIAIRTALIKDATLYVQAGAGLVYDSQPEAEWNETMSKARAMISAAVAVSGSSRREPGL